MKTVTAVLAVAAMLAPISSARSQRATHSFSFNAASISGIGSGAVFLTGGGTYDPDPAAGFLHATGAFRCTQDVNQGPFTGLKAGEGVRWDAEELLPSFDFRCTGAEALRPAVTDDNTIVIKADFYRQGDGNVASLHANMFVSADDEGEGRPGIVWIQGVGCGEAIVNFR